MDIAYSNTTPGLTFTYDRLGRLTSATSSASTRIFEYTGLALTKETQDNYIIERMYDKRGRTIGYELYNSDDLIDPVQTIIYGYSENGLLESVQSVKSAETNFFTYSRLPGTDLISGYTVTTSSTPSTPSTILTVSKTYEPNRNLITSVSNLWNTALISAFDYENNALGQRIHRADYFNASTIINDFTYNIFGEVTGALMDDDNYTYKNDPIGNRAWSQLNGSTNLYTANQLNQYTFITGGMMATPTHDNDGNMTWNGRKILSYDAENRLLSAAPNYWGITNGATRTDYTYDYMNRRVSKSVSVMSGRSISFPPSPRDPQGAWNALETRNYIYDGWNLVAEIIIDQTEFNTNANYYTWGLDLSGTLQGAGGVGGLLTTTISTHSTDSTYLTLSDANGNITEYVDDTGAVTAHYEYNAFGETTYKSGTMKDVFVFRLSTKYYDPETGFYYYGHRYYDPILMRWLSRDPIGIKGGNNLYRFVDNDAVNWLDYLGMVLIDMSDLGDNGGKVDVSVNGSSLCSGKEDGVIEIVLTFIVPGRHRIGRKDIDDWGEVFIGDDMVGISDAVCTGRGNDRICKFTAKKKLSQPRCPFYGTGDKEISVRWNKTDGMHPVPGVQSINISWRYSCIKEDKKCCREGIPFEVDVKPEYYGYGN